MLGLRDALEGPKEELIVIQAEVPGEPPDIDRKGSTPSSRTAASPSARRSTS